MGRFRTLEGEELPYEIASRGPRGGRMEEMARRRFRSAHDEEPLGMRLSRTWTPEADVGLPVEDRSGFVPMGAQIEVDPDEGEFGAALGAGGSGGGASFAPEDEKIPIGAKPSVPARIGVNFERVGRPAEITREPYGMLPLEASLNPPPGSLGSPFIEESGSGLIGHEGAGDLRLIEPYRQFVPPLPASQDICIVNGFDPRWGEPPRTYKGVVVRFDYARGAYRFSPNDESLRMAFERSGDPRLMGWFDDMARRYQSGSMLQPYKPQDGSGRWDFRWVPLRQEIVCV